MGQLELRTCPAFCSGDLSWFSILITKFGSQCPEEVAHVLLITFIEDEMPLLPMSSSEKASVKRRLFLHTPLSKKGEFPLI